MRTVLITGGSGYLGQFLLQHLAADSKVFYTYHSTLVQGPPFKHAKGFYVDFATGEGLQDCFKEVGELDVVINCAAISQPQACELDVDAARAVNVPTKLLDALDALLKQPGREPLLIQLSTDQVYDGSSRFYSEDDPPRPINVYGRTKLEAEQCIQMRWPNHIILRSSIIYGPQCPVAVSRRLFLQFIESALSQAKPTPFYNDQWRSPIYVQDICRVVAAAIARCLPGSTASPPKHRLFNMGGPRRLSRADMAGKVAAAWGYDSTFIRSVPTASVVKEGAVPAPEDISMDCSRLVSELGVSPRPMVDALMEMQAQSTGISDLLGSSI